MCAVYEVCEACDVDHGYAGTICKWKLTDVALFYLNMHPEHPFVDPGLEKIEHTIQMLLEQRAV